MAKITKKEFVKGSFWKIVEQFSTKGVSLIISIVLARILNPDVYGLIALTYVFLNLSDILIDGGFSTALIRKESVDDCDYSCVLTTSVSIATFLYIILFVFAPFISGYYNEPELVAVLRVMGIVVFIQAFTCVRTAIINRNMQFKLLFRCNFIGTLISGIIGIVAAYIGFGVWALVIQRILQQILVTTLLLIKVNFKIKYEFRWDRFKQLFSFSIGVVTSSLINYLTGSICSLVVGKKYSVTDLGYYDKGAQLPTQVSLYTFGAMSNVLLPTLSSYQSDICQMKRIVRKVTHMTAFLITPMMVGLAFVSEEIIVVLLTEKWLQAAPILVANCLYYFATPFMLINVQIFFALGHSESRVKTEILRLILQLGGIVIFGIILGCSMVQLAWVCAFVALLAAIITFFEAKPMIDYRASELISDIVKPIVASIIMGIVIYVFEKFVLINISFESVLLVLILKVLLGCLIYILVAWAMKIEGFKEVLDMFKSFRRKEA